MERILSSDRARRSADIAIGVLFGLQLIWVIWHFGGFVAGPLTVSFPVLAFTLVLVVVRWTVMSQHEIPAGWWWPLPFLIWAFLHAHGFAEVPGRAQLHALLVVQGAIAFWVGLQVAPTHRAKALIYVISVGLVVAAAAISVYQRVADPTWLPMGREQWLYYLTRSSGVFGNPNNFAAWLALGLPVSLAVASGRLTQKLWMRGIGGTAVLAAIIGIGLSQSRGVLLTLLLALLGWLLLRPDWKLRWRLGGGIGLIVLSLLTGALAYRIGPNFSQRVDTFIEFKGERTRPEMWHIAVELWRDRPVVGNGGGSYAALMEKHRRAGLWETPEYAHNDYLNLLSDYGAVGTLLLLLPFSVGGFLLLKSRKHHSSPSSAHGVERRSLGWGLGILAGAILIDFHLQSPGILMTAGLMLGVLVGQLHHRKRKTNAFFTNQLQAVMSVGLMGLIVGGTTVLARKGSALYEAENLREVGRQIIDELAGEADPEVVRVRAAAAAGVLKQASAINSRGDRIWSDLSYSISLQAYKNFDLGAELGDEAEYAARQALDGSEEVAEYWIRLGVALDLQGRWGEAGRAFGRAVRLAPRQPVVWFYQGFHFSLKPMTREMGIAALATCLRLDPSYEEAKLLKVALERRD